MLEKVPAQKSRLHGAQSSFVGLQTIGLQIEKF